MAAIAEKLGVPPMPHQQLVWDVALEIDPATGVFAYREVIVTMMRQMGKTVTVFGAELDRCIMWPEPQRVLYSAQTGTEGRKKLLEDQWPLLRDSPLRSTVTKVHQSSGNERLSFRTGSILSVSTKSEESGHGFTVDMGVIDEAWKDEDHHREQSMVPAMNTRPWAQLWICSTQGTDKSTYLNQKTEVGREAAASGRDTGIAYFEWSIPPEADIEDPEVWWRYMPALGWTIQPSAVAHALETMDETEWRRAYGNQRTTLETEQVIPQVLWEMVCGPTVEVDRNRPVWLGCDVLPDRSAAALVASDGIAAELIDHRPGTTWVVPRLVELVGRWQCDVVVDGGGPAASLVPDLLAAGVPVTVLSGPEFVTACATLYDAIADSTVKVRTCEPLNVAVEGLAKRPIGDRFVWSRAASATDITPLVALTLAYDRATHAVTAPAAFYSFG
ncbi:MAG: hypothetical protein ABFE07_17145 [Armatimonadia bacterium]